MSVVVEFLGAAGTVTGSRFLVRSDRATVLVDAGLFQGSKRDRLSNWEPFPVDPHEIDAVVLTHAHIDHSGWLPGLVRDGFDGPIIATAQTRDLCAILLPDAAHLHEEQARFTNERGFGKHHPALPLYTSDDAARVPPLFRAVPFDTPVSVVDGFTAVLVPAGHILGSASVHLTIEDDGGSTTLLVSGDLGSRQPSLGGGPGPSTGRRHRAGRVDLRRLDPPAGRRRDRGVRRHRHAHGRPGAGSCSSRRSPSTAPRSS